MARIPRIAALWSEVQWTGFRPGAVPPEEIPAAGRAFAAPRSHAVTVEGRAGSTVGGRRGCWINTTRLQEMGYIVDVGLIVRPATWPCLGSCLVINTEYFTV